MKKLIILLTISCITVVVTAQTFTNYTYEYSDSVFNNPERGFYKYTERDDANTSLDLNTLMNYRDLGYTLIYRIFYLRDFVDSPISEAYLAKIKDDFNKMREAGIKGVIRFAYTSSMTAPYGDATPTRVFSHIAQLKPILTDNSDVILVLQAGFIGAWGEWYYTDHFATGSPSNVTDEDMAKRKELVYKLLDAFPTDRMIQLRYVGYKMRMFDSIPVTLDEAYSGSPKSRISHHNDCFVSSDNDVGSYRNIFFDKNYLEQDTKYTSVGGETCDYYAQRSNCDTTTSEMARFHWSFINQDYYGPTINQWDESGCLSEIVKKLGYRYYLINAHIQDSSKQNGSFNITFKMENVGYSNPINPRDIEIVIRNKASGKLYYAQINAEIRKQELNTAFQYAATIGISPQIPNGDYDVYLNLPDPKPALRNNPDYSIRLANINTWNSTLGMNSLMHTLHINDNASCDLYAGDEYFISTTDNHSDTLSVPQLFITSFGKNAIISIAPEESDTSSLILIEQSSDINSGYSTVAVLGGMSGSLYFVADQLGENSNYYYRAVRAKNDEYSDYSAPRLLTTGAGKYKYPVITTDGSENDWNAIPPVNAITDRNLEFFFKAYTDNMYLNLLLQADTIVNPDIFIDTDNNPLTGENNSNWLTSGFDYKYADGNLYHYESGSYVKITHIDSVSGDTHNLEIKIPLIILNIDNSNTYLNFAEHFNFGDNDFFMPFKGRKSSLYERVLPPEKPQGFDVRHSVNSPSSKLIITWDKCTDCSGYLLTRIDKTNKDTTTFDLQGIENQLIDDGLSEGVLYGYFVCSYNFGGKSENSDSVTLTTTGIFDHAVTRNGILIWPIPAKDNIHIKYYTKSDEESSELKIYTIEGKLMYRKIIYFDHLNYPIIATVPTNNLKGGIYLLNITTQKRNLVQKFTKE